jgi:hypothetical protein
MMKDRMSQGMTLRAREEKEWMPALTEEAITDDYPPTIINEPRLLRFSPKSEWYLQMRVINVRVGTRKDNDRVVQGQNPVAGLGTTGAHARIEFGRGSKSREVLESPVLGQQRSMFQLPLAEARYGVSAREDLP